MNSFGEEVISCFQIGGDSNSDKIFSWRLFKVNKIFSLIVLKEQFMKVRDGYKQVYEGMSRTFCELQ
jgi:hypothetical protein